MLECADAVEAKNRVKILNIVFFIRYPYPLFNRYATLLKTFEQAHR